MTQTLSIFRVARSKSNVMNLMLSQPVMEFTSEESAVVSKSVGQFWDLFFDQMCDMMKRTIGKIFVLFFAVS